MFKNILTSGLLGAAMLLGVTACSDDHFDVLADGVSGTKSLWENIREGGKTDSLALIMQRTIVMKSETDKSGKIYYADLFNQPQSFTLWAPKDGTYNAKYYLDLLDKRDALFAKSSDPESDENKEAWQLNWTVANQFVQNHVARFNYEGNTTLQKVRLLNAKHSYYDPAALTFNNVSVDNEAMPSNNGTIHFLSGVSPFAYNIYDYIVYHDEFSKLWGVLSDPTIDKRIFSEAASTEGAMNENGEMVYVDSVFIHSNEILDGSGAYLSNEDSLYIALLPTDNAWDKAYETVSNLYRYGTRYRYEWNETKGSFEQEAQFNTDSLQSYNANRLLIQSPYFSTSRFSVPNQSDSAQVNNYALTADSLQSTNNTIFYNPNQGGQNPNFDGKQPVKASNGYIYPVDNFNVNPAYTWIQKTEIKLASDYFVANVTGANSTKGSLVILTEETREDTIYGDVEDNMYRRFEVLGNSEMNVYIRLNGLYSGKYKISAEIVPTQINKSFPANENEHAVFNYELLDDEGNKIGSTVNDFATKSDSVRTYTLFESIEIPKCYVGLPSDYNNSFVRLRFQMTSRHRRPSAGNCKSLNISKIIVEPVREETL